MGGERTKRNWQLIGCEDLGKSIPDNLQVCLMVRARNMPLKEVQVSIKLTPLKNHMYLREILSHTVIYYTVFS